MKVFNTLTRQKEEFIPRQGKTVRMFVCGPTVYDYIHIGNARTFLFFDVLAKYLRYRGYQVEYLQNITDIDDKIIERAKKVAGLNADIATATASLAQEYTEVFREDMLALGITAVDRYAKATDHIKEVVAQVKKLIDGKHAYLIGDPSQPNVDGTSGWYFDLTTFPEYGKLSGRTAQMADDAVSRIDDNEQKRHRGDFCLWKFSKPGEPSWESEPGPGRPGWHIEDTAITEKYFGPQYDLHGGGQDLIFPHHEAEIAQQEAASGLQPFVKYWLHAGFLVNKEAKMSKSLGNFATLHDLLAKYPREVLRFYLLSAHYRSPLDYNPDDTVGAPTGASGLKSAEAAVTRIGEFMQRLARIIKKTEAGRAPLPGENAELIDYFNREMDDDCNTPKALAVIFETIKAVNAEIDRGQIIPDQAKSLLNQFSTINNILGIIPASTPTIPSDIQSLITQRDTARQAQDYTTADTLRDQLLTQGWQIDDTIYGPLAKKI